MRKVFILIGVLLVACGGTNGAQTAVSPPRASSIICTAAYRSSVQVGIEREETLTFTDTDDEQSAAFTDMVFHAAYRTGEADNERNLLVWVTDTADTIAQSTLYQLPIDSGPQNQFVGSHGFTGLNYSYHPDSGAEMQFWCEAGTE